MITDPVAIARSTDRADRGRAERAVLAYLGRTDVVSADPPIRWVGSPLQVVTTAFDAFDGAGLRADPNLFEGLPLWSAWAGVGLFDTDEDLELGGAATDIAHVVASAIIATDPGRFREQRLAIEWIVRDAGQFDGRIERALADARWGDLDPTTEAARRIELLVDLWSSAGPSVILAEGIVASDRPLLLRLDDRGRPHAEDGPAIAYPDGFEAWAWHGVSVPSWLITDPGRTSVARIDGETNAEIRRAMIERFGAERLIREGGAKLIHEDETGRLWRRTIGPQIRYQPSEEPVVMVEVINSTPEPDGSRKTYFLRVPPRTETARAGVAWTFGLRSDGYAPGVET